MKGSEKQVRPIGKNIEENSQHQNLSYMLGLTKRVDHISKCVLPSCYVIFTLIYVTIYVIIPLFFPK